jgi:DNA gyrase subunit A
MAMHTRSEDFMTYVFVANTLTPVLFFSNKGMAYQRKVWRFPAGTPQSRGKLLSHVLPITEGEVISTVLPLDRPQAEWGDLFLMFVTSSGNIRRNPLSDFAGLKNVGKIAMKLEDESERLISVQLCRETDDVMLVTRTGRAVRISASAVREFKSRGSTGVRGIRLRGDDEVVGMTVLNHTDASVEEARAYLKKFNVLRRLALAKEGEDLAAIETSDIDLIESDDDETGMAVLELTDERFESLAAQEQFVFLMSSDGYGKRTSTYNFRVSGRGTQGVQSFALTKRGGVLLGAFSVKHEEHIMAITDAGQVIRFPVSQVSLQSRNTSGVRLFRTGEDETIVSITCLTAEQVASTGDDDTTIEGEDEGVSVTETLTSATEVTLEE